MKKLKRVALLLVTLMLGTMVVACGGEEKKEVKKATTPTEALRVQIDVEIFAKGEEKAAIGVTDEEFNKNIEQMNKTYDALFSSATATATEEEKKAQKTIIDALVKGISKSEIKFGEEKITGDKATVKVSIKGIDMKKTFANILLEMQAQGTLNTTASEKEFVENVLKSLVKQFENPPLLEKAKNITVEMKKVGEYWKADANQLKNISASIMDAESMLDSFK